MPSPAARLQVTSVLPSLRLHPSWLQWPNTNGGQWRAQWRFESGLLIRGQLSAVGHKSRHTNTSMYLVDFFRYLHFNVFFSLFFNFFFLPTYVHKYLTFIRNTLIVIHSLCSCWKVRSYSCLVWGSSRAYLRGDYFTLALDSLLSVFSIQREMKYLE